MSSGIGISRDVKSPMRAVYVPNSGTFTADVELDFGNYGHVQQPPDDHPKLLERC